MTQEEKAKAYDEALTIAKRIISKNCSEVEKLCLKSIFPELAESEDERTRKWLLDYAIEMIAGLESDISLSNYDGIKGHDPEAEAELAQWQKARAYLEKQKEQKPAQSEEEKEYVRTLKGLVSDFIRDSGGGITDVEYYQNICDWLDGRHIEQKPAEWDDYTKTNLGRAIQIIKDARGTLHGYQTDDGIYECDKAIEALEHFLYRGLEIEKSAEWSEEDEENFKWFDKFFRAESVVSGGKDIPQDKYLWFKSRRPQPKQEWSEEDEEMLNSCICSIEESKENRYAYKETDGDTSYDHEIAWLKSLRPQSKKELSIEKAIQWLDDTFYFLNNSSGRGRDCEITTHDFDSLEEMYDSFRKAVTVDSEPSWKPSEEQMESLAYAIQVLNSNPHPKSAKAYQDLQTLYKNIKYGN